MSPADQNAPLQQYVCDCIPKLIGLPKAPMMWVNPTVNMRDIAFFWIDLCA
jgi:hypothetical protein